MNSTKTIFDRLSSASGLAARLAEHAGAAAIFNDRAPDSFVFDGDPAVIIAAPSANDDAGTFTETIRGVTQDVRIYTKDNGSTLEIDDLARDIRDLFHLQAAALTVSGGTVTTATATGPVAAPTTDPSIIGRRVTLRLELKRN
jgi:hypothetical protein